MQYILRVCEVLFCPIKVQDFVIYPKIVYELGKSDFFAFCGEFIL